MNVDVGQKLKILRLRRGLTQKELAGDVITRNMLSQIERGAALPSYQTIEYLSGKLGIDPGYFFDGVHDLLFYELQRVLPRIRSLYDERRYDSCIRLAEPYEKVESDELFTILSECHYHLAISDFERFDFDKAMEHLAHSEQLSVRCRYPSYFFERIAFYRKLISIFRSGEPIVPSAIMDVLPSKDGYSDFLIYNFLIALIESDQADKATAIYNTVRIKNEFYRSHFNARLAASLHNYDRAKELLWSIVNSGKLFPSPFLYKVYDDLERYCKTTEDYEGAYRCAIEKQNFPRGS